MKNYSATNIYARAKFGVKKVKCAGTQNNLYTKNP